MAEPCRAGRQGCAGACGEPAWQGWGLRDSDGLALRIVRFSPKMPWETWCGPPAARSCFCRAPPQLRAPVFPLPGASSAQPGGAVPGAGPLLLPTASVIGTGAKSGAGPRWERCGNADKAGLFPLPLEKRGRKDIQIDIIEAKCLGFLNQHASPRAQSKAL